jgi:hypothetical protein
MAAVQKGMTAAGELKMVWVAGTKVNARIQQHRHAIKDN